MAVDLEFTGLFLDADDSSSARSASLQEYYTRCQKKNVVLLVWIRIWVNYNDLTASSLEIIVSKGNHPQMALIQVSELL